MGQAKRKKKIQQIQTANNKQPLQGSAAAAPIITPPPAAATATNSNNQTEKKLAPVLTADQKKKPKKEEPDNSLAGRLTKMCTPDKDLVERINPIGKMAGNVLNRVAGAGVEAGVKAGLKAGVAEVKAGLTSLRNTFSTTPKNNLPVAKIASEIEMTAVDKAASAENDDEDNDNNATV